LKLDDIASPFLIHRRPDRMQRRWTEGKLHWSYVNPGYVSKEFAEARDQVERFATMPSRERPTFHEIRGLGSRLYRERGMATAAIQALMTHSDPKTTQIYLELGPQALTDDHFIGPGREARIALAMEGSIRP
jgi:integrase